MTELVPMRKAYTGSCHCGATKFINFITLPHTPLPYDINRPRRQRLYRCNCTTCHKLSIFHIRLDSAPDDFMLLCPTDPYKELSDYQCSDKYLHFFFCKTCGGRCFTFMGESEVVEVDLAALGVGEEALQRLGVEPGSKTTVWRPKKEKGQFVERPEMEEGEKHGYLSVNAYTIDAGQGIDLPAWTEKKWVMYLDGYNGTDEESYQKPQIGGAY